MNMKRLLNIILACAAAVLLMSQPALAQDVSAQNSRKARLEKEIQVLDSQLKANAKKSASALSSLTLTQKKIENRKALIRESEEEIAGMDRSIRAIQHRVDSLTSRLDTMTVYYNKLVKSAYKNRDARIWYMYILASDNIAQGLRRYSFLRNMSSEMNHQAENILESKSELERQTDSLALLRKNAASLRDSRMKELSSLKTDEASSQKLINTLKRDKSKYQKELDKKKAEVKALNREISRIIAEYSKQSSGKSSSGKSSASKPVDVKLGKEFASNKGKLPWPAEGAVVERFGTQYHPVYKQLKLPDSDGISIALSDGDQVKAVFNGEVKKVIVMQGYNKCVLVQHGEWFTFYCKLDQVSVKAGDKVKTGQVIGSVGPLGGVTQLHFQVWSSKGPQDPLLWLR
jgi:murein hydrolase activator